MTLTITEALQEIKTTFSRIEKQRAAITPYLVRDTKLRDPFAAEENGSAGHVARQRQSIHDLEEKIIAIRTAIQEANLDNTLELGATTRTVAEWLTWRREIASGSQRFVNGMFSTIQVNRTSVQSKGGKMVTAGAAAQVNFDATTPPELVVAVDESQLIKEIDQYEEILGKLDGKLSLFNATTTIEV